MFLGDTMQTTQVRQDEDVFSCSQEERKKVKVFGMRRLLLFSKHFHLSMLKMSTTTNVRLLNQEEAVAVDQELFNEYQFSVDQLMELAGHSVAGIIAEQYSNCDNKKVLVCCGPGNNGGDGLVASRHLKLFGFDPLVVCPKQGKGQLFHRLIHQVKRHGIQVLPSLPNDLGPFGIILDAIFGFSYRPPLRDEYYELLDQMAKSGKPLVCVDISSGWTVDEGPPSPDESSTTRPTPILQPSILISLTAPKLCAAKAVTARHFLAGRFVPPDLEKKYRLNLPQYPGVKGWMEIQLPSI